jgi:hypothetical protein
MSCWRLGDRFGTNLAGWGAAAAVLAVVNVDVRHPPLADPATGEPDNIVPLGLGAAFHHRCLGVYAKVMQGGLVRLGNPVTVE